MHYYKFNIPDWNLHTSHLSLDEEAIYLRLINYHYDTEGGIPRITQPVMRRLRLGSVLDIAERILEEFFTLDGDFWVQKRCKIEIEIYHSKIATNRANGGLGGRPRTKVKPRKTQSVSSGNPNITLTKNYKLLTNIKNKGLNKVAFDEWIDCRASKKKPISLKAAEKQIKFLTDYDHTTQQSIIDQSIAGDWLGLFEPNGGSNGKIRSGGNSGAHAPKLTPAQRTAELRANIRRKELAEQSPDAGTVAANERDIRPPVGKPAGGRTQ